MANYTVQEWAPLWRTFADKDLNKAVRLGIDDALEWAVKYVKRTYFKGGGKPGRSYIVSRTGHLKSTVRYKKARKKANLGFITGNLGMGDGSTPQARILELGGRTRSHMIYPKKARMLVFFWPKVGKLMFLRKVKHPGSVFEPRAVLGRGMARAEPRMLKSMKRLINKAAQKRLG